MRISPFLLTLLFHSLAASAQPVWHCSRNATEQQDSALSTQNDQFSIASINSSAETIGVSINDLIDIYSGVPVRVSGIPLSACFMPSDQSLTSAALSSLGLQQSTIQSLARKSTIIQSNIFFVNTPNQMQTCIGKNFPAVGYLNEPLNTDKIHPCF